MLRRLSVLVVVVAALSGVVAWKTDCFRAATPVPSTEKPKPDENDAVPPNPVGQVLYPPHVAPAPVARPAPLRAAPIVLPDCRLTVFDKQDVPSQREGVILFIGSEIEAGQQLAPEQTINVRVGGQEKAFRRLKEGDVVKAGQLLAYLDDQLSRDDWAIKNARVAASRADLEAAVKSCEEAKNRYDTQRWLRQEGRGATSEEDVRAAKLTWDKATYEAMGKKEAVTLAERELSQAETVLRMHQVRATTPGVIKTIYKKPGEAVKGLEPVFQIHQLARLRVEGLVDVHHLPALRPGMRAIVEPSRPEGPRQTFVGHLKDITSVAVSKTGDIVSASEDGTARVWDRAAQRERCILRHPASVLTVACTGGAAPTNLCLTGAADGKARLWDLNGKCGEPLRELKTTGECGIACVAFSPDGKACATGDEDAAICLWDVATGTLRYRFPAVHRAAVTSLQFTPKCQLVSAGRDNTLRLWTVGQDAAKQEATFDGRGGDVAQLGVSPDGGRVLFDLGSTLQVLSLPDGLTDGAIQNVPRGASFATFALFSPDARLVLTASAGEGRLRLWQAPTATTRPVEVRQLVSPDSTAASGAAFAPDGSFVAIGGRDRRVRVWSVPAQEETERQVSAEVTLIDRAVESSTREARIWAELPNADGRLLPGTTVTLVLDGEER